jgi:c-di-GMP phosphodiesterase
MFQCNSNQGQAERLLLSRQPIYRSDMTLLGYELLYRYHDPERAMVTDGTQATAQVMVNALMEVGLDAMVGRHLAFVNFERALVMSGCCDALPPDRSVVEILENIKPDRPILRKLEQLRSKGYRIALDDFVCREPFLPLLECADFVKLDVLAMDWTELERAISRISRYPARMVAEKVETREQAERCRQLGFHYFQGYFFCRPQNVSGRPLPANRLAIMNLLTQLNKPEIKIEELERTIGQDVSLSYKLLRYINSAMCSLDRDVDSLRHATVLVGLEKMRIWATLIVFSGFEATSQDVIVTGTVRARMCELLATSLRLPNPERHFLVGLFSVLDAILDRPLEQVLATLSLSDEIKQALLHHEGELGTVLKAVQCYERRDWADAQASVQLVQNCIEQSYVDALAWSANMVGLSARAGSGPDKH